MSNRRKIAQNCWNFFWGVGKSDETAERREEETKSQREEETEGVTSRVTSYCHFLFYVSYVRDVCNVRDVRNKRYVRSTPSAF